MSSLEEVLKKKLAEKKGTSQKESPSIANNIANKNKRIANKGTQKPKIVTETKTIANNEMENLQSPISIDSSFEIVELKKLIRTQDDKLKHLMKIHLDLDKVVQMKQTLNIPETQEVIRRTNTEIINILKDSSEENAQKVIKRCYLNIGESNERNNAYAFSLLYYILEALRDEKIIY